MTGFLDLKDVNVYISETVHRRTTISKLTPTKVTIVFRLVMSLCRHRGHVTGFLDLKDVNANISETVHRRTMISKLTPTKVTIVFRLVMSL